MRRFLGAIRSGPAAMVIEGEPGIGKTSLWWFTVSEAMAASDRVLSSRPAESESDMAFAGLGDLLDHVMEEVLPALPSPQRLALERAMLRAEFAPRDEGLDQRAAGLAFLGSLRTLVVSSPVVVAVDDLQWLDRPSARVLEFAIRRLEDEPVGLLLSKRLGELDGLAGRLIEALPKTRTERICLGPLGPRAVEQLLRERMAASLPSRTLGRLHAVSAGNPLFAMEIAGAILEGDGSLSVRDMVPIPQTLRGLVARRLSSLPAGVLHVLLVAAALSRPTVELVRRATDDQRKTDAALARAAQRGVITTEDPAVRFLGLDPQHDPMGTRRIRFTHPLLASVIYADASPETRQRVHRRLAEVLTDPEERARHMALGSETADERVAAELEEAATRARARGALETAAELGEEACRLTPADRATDARRRIIRTADYLFGAGDTARARELLQGAVEISSPGPARADALRRLGWLRYHEDSYIEAVSLLRSAAAEAGDEPATRLAIERDLAWADLRFGHTTSAARHARTALKLAEGMKDPVALAEALTAVGLAEATLGRGVRRDILQRAIELEERGERQGMTQRPSRTAGILLQATDDLDSAWVRYQTILHDAAARGNQGSMPLILANLSEIEYRQGHWSEAESHAEEGYAAAIRTGQESARARLLYAKALLHAHRGVIETAQVEAREGALLAERIGAAGLAVANESVLGFIELSLGDPLAAHSHLGPLVDLVASLRLTEPEVVRFLPDEIEALIALAELEDAGHLLARLERRGRALGPGWARLATARCRSLLLAARGDAHDAVGLLERAERMQRHLGQPFESGRTLLALGTLRRRAKQKRPAREALERAGAIFDELGAVLWSERARRELSRISGRSADPAGLTPTEWRVAGLVAQGRTNREVAGMLFMSVRAVDSNLSRIYHKLHVRSRTELAAKVLSERPSVAPQPAGS